MPELPRVPTARDLLLQPAEMPRSHPTGLFAELLVDRPEPLHLDAEQHPARYDDVTKKLLGELVTGRVGISAEERILLDRATYTFATMSTRLNEPIRETRTKMAAVQEEDEDEEQISTEELPDFWWRR
jgi:hypothetical protein